jgi:hypothetical protein
MRLQVGLTTALMRTKGQAGPETKASLDQARWLMERAEAMGEPLEDPLLLFSALYAFWIVNYTGGAADETLQLAMHASASAGANEAGALADGKGFSLWKAAATMVQGCVIASTGSRRTRSKR